MRCFQISYEHSNKLNRKTSLPFFFLVNVYSISKSYEQRMDNAKPSITICSASLCTQKAIISNKGIAFNS